MAIAWDDTGSSHTWTRVYRLPGPDFHGIDKKKTATAHMQLPTPLFYYNIAIWPYLELVGIKYKICKPLLLAIPG